jgi:riboflavin biosynthesis pyrimidine reductase
LIFTTNKASIEAKRIWKSNNVSYIESELTTDGKPSLRFVLETLAADYGVLQLLVEGKQRYFLVVIKWSD